MTNPRVLPVIIIFCACTSGCGTGSLEDVYEEKAAFTKKVATILEGVDGKESADATAAKFNEMIPEYQELEERWKTLKANLRGTKRGKQEALDAVKSQGYKDYLGVRSKVFRECRRISKNHAEAWKHLRGPLRQIGEYSALMEAEN